MKAKDSCRCHLTRSDGTEWIVTELHLGGGGPFVTARRLDGRAAEGVAKNGGAPNGSAPNGSAPNGSAPSGSAPNGSAPNGSAPNGSAPNGSAPNGSAPNGDPKNGSLLEEPLTAGDRLEWVSEDGTVRWAMRIPVGLGAEKELRRSA